MQHKYILACDIETISPLQISDVIKGKYDTQTGRIHRYDDAPGIGSSLTRTLELAPHAAADLDESDTGTTSRPKSFAMPVITATTLRSRLRNACCDMIFSSWIARGIHADVNVVNAMRSGAHTTTPVPDARTPRVDVFCRREPFWGLWGGSSIFLHGSTQVCDGMPLVERTLHMLAAPAMAEPAYGVRGLSDMTQAIPILRTDPVADGKGDNLSELTGMDALNKAHEERMGQRSQSKANKKASKEAGQAVGKKTELRALNAVEVARAGLRYGLRVSLRSPTPAHLGLVVLAMQELLRTGQIGAGYARSFGQFIGLHSRLYEVDPATARMQAICEAYGDKASGYALLQDKTLAEAVAAAQDYVAEVEYEPHRAIVYADTAAIHTLYDASAS